MNSTNLLILLKFLVNNCAPLFESHKFTITYTEVGPTHVSGASVILESEDVQIFLSIEKEEITLQIRSLQEAKKNWHGFQQISLLLGHQTSTGLLNNESNAVFLAKSWDEIVRRFDKEHLAETLETLNKLKSESYARLGFSRFPGKKT